MIQCGFDLAFVRLLPAVAAGSDHFGLPLGPQTVAPAFVDLQLQSPEATQICRLNPAALNQKQVVLLQQQSRQRGPEPGNLLPQGKILGVRFQRTIIVHFQDAAPLSFGFSVDNILIIH